MLEAGPGLRRRRPHSPHPLTQLCLVVLHCLIVWTTRKAAEEKGGRLTSLVLAFSTKSVSREELLDLFQRQKSLNVVPGPNVGADDELLTVSLLYELICFMRWPCGRGFTGGFCSKSYDFPPSLASNSHKTRRGKNESA